MTPATGRGSGPHTEEDAEYLRAALKPFDPATRPRPNQSPAWHDASNLPHDGSGGRRPARSRTVLLTAAAAAAVIVGAFSLPAVFGSSSHGPATQPEASQTPAEASYSSCQDRAQAAGSPTGAPSDPVGMYSSRVSDPTLTTWYTDSKQRQLDTALRSGLPAGVCVFPGSGMGDLLFSDPATVQSPVAGDPPLSPQAIGRIVTPSGDGTLMATVYHAADGQQSCQVGTGEDVPDAVSITTADGTSISQATTSSSNGTSSFEVLLVQAARMDGSCVWLRLSDEVPRGDSAPGEVGTVASGSVPLTIDQLTTLAGSASLSTSS